MDVGTGAAEKAEAARRVAIAVDPGRPLQEKEVRTRRAEEHGDWQRGTTGWEERGGVVGRSSGVAM